MVLIYKDIDDSHPLIFGGNLVWTVKPLECGKSTVLIKDTQGDILFNKSCQKVDIGFNNGFIYAYIEYNKKKVDSVLAF